jgi:hypothetical protein
VQIEKIWVGLAKKEEVALALKGGSIIGLNFIFPPFDKESVLDEFRIALKYKLKAKKGSIFLKKIASFYGYMPK